MELHIFRMMVIPAKHGKLICRVPVMLLPENDCADISAWTKILKGIKIYYGDNYGTTQENNAYKVDNLGRYCMFA